VGAPIESAHRIDRFVEKPDASTAAKYLDDGGYLWNSGMFLFSAETFLRELGMHEPVILSAVEKSVATATTNEGVWLDPGAFASSPSTSIDYAVMEQTDRGVVVPLDAGWSDVGSWEALHAVTPHDDAGNTVVGDVTILDTANSYLRSDGRLVTAIGLDSMFVVDTLDALIVGPLDRSQDVKNIVDALAERGRTEVRSPTSGVESWGTWRRVDTHHATVMEFVIEPGATAELQHHHEIVVVRGSVSTIGVEARASLTSGDVMKLTRPRMTNIGQEPAVLIVVETEENA